MEGFPFLLDVPARPGRPSAPSARQVFPLARFVLLKLVRTENFASLAITAVANHHRKAVVFVHIKRCECAIGYRRDRWPRTPTLYDGACRVVARPPIDWHRSHLQGAHMLPDTPAPLPMNDTSDSASGTPTGGPPKGWRCF